MNNNLSKARGFCIATTIANLLWAIFGFLMMLILILFIFDIFGGINPITDGEKAFFATFGSILGLFLGLYILVVSFLLLFVTIPAIHGFVTLGTVKKGYLPKAVKALKRDGILKIVLNSIIIAMGIALGTEEDLLSVGYAAWLFIFILMVAGAIAQLVHASKVNVNINANINTNINTNINLNGNGFYY